MFVSETTVEEATVAVFVACVGFDVVVVALQLTDPPVLRVTPHVLQTYTASANAAFSSEASQLARTQHDTSLRKD